MIRKWKATPVSKHRHEIIARSNDDSVVNEKSKKDESRSKKNRRHTTGNSKQTADDIRLARKILDDQQHHQQQQQQQMDGNNTLGRKQLISMLKQRYGPEIESYRSSAEFQQKDKHYKGHQVDGERIHQYTSPPENRELNRHGGVQNMPGNWSSNSYRMQSDCSSVDSSPTTKRSMFTTNIMPNRRIARRTHSIDSAGEACNSYSGNSDDGSNSSRGIAFLQYRDEVKRVMLPNSVTSLDTVKALFVGAFASRIAMPHFENGDKLIYIKDMETGVFYQLENTEDVLNRCFMKIHEQNNLQYQSWDSIHSQTIVDRRPYAESLQDYDVSPPAMRRAMRSESEVLRPFQNRGGGEQKITNKEVLSPVMKRKPISTSERAVTVEDQLADLTDLLHTALNEEEAHSMALDDCVNIKNPGKLDRNLVNGLEHKTQEIQTRHAVLPKHFKPTVIMAAQEKRSESVAKRKTSSSSDTSDVFKESEHSMKVSSDLLEDLFDLEKQVKSESNVTSRKSSISKAGSSVKGSTVSIVTSSEQQPIIQTTKSVQKKANPITIVSKQKTSTVKISARKPPPQPSTLPQPSAIAANTMVSADDQAEQLLQSLSQPIYAQVSKPIASSKVQITAVKEVTPPNSPASPTATTGKICKPSSVTTPDFIELEDSACAVKKRLSNLREELSEMRKVHVENSRQFKATLQKQVLLFRKKISKVEEHLQGQLDINNNFIFAHEHPVRERRHRLTTDQLEYNQRRSTTTETLKSLEGRMEKFRMGVVTKKRVEDPHQLDVMQDELTSCARGLSEVKNRYHGLIDMIRHVIQSEKEVIVEEEKFLENESECLEALIQRCKTLTETLHTLQRLAAVQSDATKRQNKPILFAESGMM